MVGRTREIKELNKRYNSKKSELIAIYGRRRVGKTFLVDETFEGKFAFRHAGLSPENNEDDKGLLRAQLHHFYNSLVMQGMKECKEPDNWLDAFLLLEKYLQKKDNGSRQLIFLDELPWLDTPRSGFLRAFEGFWNNWACHRKNIMVIVSGSANSWILNNLIGNHGGLYNRVTFKMKLYPFTLKECEEFYTDNDIRFSPYDIVQSYMIFGGIPYYMNYVDGEYSLAQNVDKIFFDKEAYLKDEYDTLFQSVFANPEVEKSLVKLISTRNSGYTRAEISERSGLSNGGGLSRYLNALLASGFVTKYVPFGKSKREEHYKVVDPFCLFFLHFKNEINGGNDGFWQQNLSAQLLVTWRGFAFENVCFNHIPQIKNALGISGVNTMASAWSKREDDSEGTQIDLVLSRNDNVVNMCELKYYGEEFNVNKDYYRKLIRRQELLMKEVSRKTVVRSTLITTYGLKRNEYSGVFTNVITLEDLFK